MSDLSSDQLKSLLLGAAGAAAANWLSEKYIDKPGSAARTWKLVDLEFTGMSNLDIIEGGLPLVIRYFKPELISEPFAVGWALSYVLAPWAHGRYDTLLSKFGIQG